MIVITDIFADEQGCRCEMLSTLDESQFKEFCKNLVIEDGDPDLVTIWDECVENGAIYFTDDGKPQEFMCVVTEDANDEFRYEGGWTIIKQFV